MTDGWELLRQEVLLDSPYLRVVRETLRTPACPDGREWTRAVRKAGVSIAPRQSDGSFILIREERVPARRDFWQFPAGQVDDESASDSIEAAARRELGEEAGCRTGEPLEYLGKFFTSPGFTDEHTHQFLASNVLWEPSMATHDAGEEIFESRAFSSGELRRMIAEGVIEDANTLSLYGRLAARGMVP